MKKPFPRFGGDEEMEAFLDTADLDEYDLTVGAMPRDDWFAHYERYIKDASIHLRLPASLLDAVRRQAAIEKIPTQRLIREYVERGLLTSVRGGSEGKVRMKAR
jgi:predicted DNA binding CopG/RHH family protein